MPDSFHLSPPSGASILFSTNAATLSNGTSSGSKVIATTDGAGAASVTLTLPSAAQTVTVAAEGPFGLGHPVVTFTEISQSIWRELSPSRVLRDWFVWPVASPAKAPDFSELRGVTIRHGYEEQRNFFARGGLF